MRADPLVNHTSCQASPRRALVTGAVLLAARVDPARIVGGPAGEARARLDALRLPKLPKCASLEQAFVHCSAAIRKADRTGCARCVDRADDVDLAVRRREILTALWASDPEVEAFGPAGVVRFFDRDHVRSACSRATKAPTGSHRGRGPPFTAWSRSSSRRAPVGP